MSPDNYYTYDALYRLIIAEGREQRNTNNAVNYNDNGRTGGSTMPFVNSTNTSDLNALQRYTQKYSYDETGNMLQMKHWAGTSNSWTRDFTISNTNNRTTGSSIGSNTTGTETLSYDARGNLTGGLNHLLNGSSMHTDTMEYNAENRLQKVWVNGTTIQAFYQYDAGGQRIRKVWKNTSGTILRTRLYIGEWELYTDKNYVTNAITLQRETLNVMDDQSRIALVDTPTTLPGGSSETQVLRYQFSNHLGIASLELSNTAAIISYEEYYPYGSTSFQSGRSGAEVSLKRYRYTGKERDEETGLYYHGARYYVPWLARWCASDPINIEFYNYSKGQLDRNVKRQFIELCASSYEYCYDNPIRFNDLSGEQPPDLAFSPYVNRSENRYPNAMSTGRAPIVIPNKPIVESKNPVVEFGKGLGDVVLGAVQMWNSMWEHGKTNPNAKSLKQLGKDLVLGIVTPIANILKEPDNPRNWGQISGLIIIAKGGKFEGKFTRTDLGFRVDLMGGSKSRYGEGWINYDKEATEGINAEVSEFSRHFGEGTVAEMIVDNPRADFLIEVGEAMRSGGTITVRGGLSNKFFNKVWNGKAEGLENFEVIKKAENVSNPGYMQSGGKEAVGGQINEIILRKK